MRRLPGQIAVVIVILSRCLTVAPFLVSRVRPVELRKVLVLKTADDGGDEKEPKRTVQQVIEDIEHGQDRTILGFTPENFDQSKLPVPLFTSILILFGSLYLTAYGFYVGLYGLPDN